VNPLRWLLNRHAPILPDDRQNERLRQLLPQALRAEADRIFPDPHTSRWPDLCTPGDPCRITHSNEADRAEWHNCPAHALRGRHHRVTP
jgi:hypothetical protein